VRELRIRRERRRERNKGEKNWVEAKVGIEKQRTGST